MSRPSVSVVIPTLNEAENLRHVLPRIPGFVDEVILVDGHSTDGTVDRARELHPDIHVVMQEGRGKGAALRSGFAAASGDILIMLDADGSTDPGEIPYFVHALLGGADFAKGSRFLHGAGTSDMPFHRRWGNAAFVHMVRRLYGGRYTDLCYGYNALWRYVLPLLDLDGDGFEIETMMNIRALRAGLRIVEVPSFEDRRVMGVGRLRTIPDGWRVLRTIVNERRRKVEFIDRAGLSLPLPAVPIRPRTNGHGPMANGHGAAPDELALPGGIAANQARRNGQPSPDVHASTNGHAAALDKLALPGGIVASQVRMNGHVPTNGHSATNAQTHEWETDAIAAGSVSEMEYVSIPIGGPALAEGSPWEAQAVDYIGRLKELVDRVDRAAIGAVVEELRAARDRGASVFLAGNGGSAATAAHWVNDLGKATKASGRTPMRVMSLSDNVPWLTALGNDEGIDRIFAGQLENFARPGDVVVIVSASGNSPNILRLLELARASGLRTIGLVGFDGGAALPMLDRPLWVETEQGAYGLVETAHTVLADIITTCLIHDRAPALDASV